MNAHRIFDANKWILEKFSDAVLKRKSILDKLYLSEFALRVATREGTGYFSSFSIEDTYRRIAESIEVHCEQDFDAGSVLIVLSRGYESGGHTRVVERWIETDARRRYSVSFTWGQPFGITQRLRNAVEKSGGRIVTFPDTMSFKDRASELRKISSKFESVVLFSHMDDVVPIMAYATSEFKRPVGFYNHADHRFWLGVGIVDCIAEMREWGHNLTQNFRGATCDFKYVPVPMDTSAQTYVAKSEARGALGISIAARVVLTVGRYPKYCANNSIVPEKVFDAVLSKDPSVMVVCVGGTPACYPEWENLVEKYGERFRCIHVVPHGDLAVYYAAADLVWDSLPMGGITAMADAVRNGRVILSMMSSVDWIAAGSGCCGNVEELVEKTLAWIKDEARLAQIAKEQYALLVSCAGADAFASAIDRFMETLIGLKHIPFRLFKPVNTGYTSSIAHYIKMKGDDGLFWRAPFYLVRPVWLSRVIRRFLSVCVSFVEKIRDMCQVRVNQGIV